jgi:Secretion system C-terminal sorting domain
VALKTSDLSIEKPKLTSIKSVVETNFKFYPNPTNGFLTIENPNEKATHYCIYNVTGTKMSDDNLNIGVNEIDMNGFVNGLYFIRFMDIDEMKTVKIVKN